MCKAAVAEWILSLFVSRERASAVVGDLVERRSGVWLAVFRVSVSAVSRDLSDRPGPLIFLALQALVLDFALILLGGHLNGNMLVPYPLVTGCCLGLWLAWRAPGREMGAVVVYVLTCLVAFVVLYATVPGASIHFTWPVQETALLIAMMASRRRRMRHA